MKFMDSINFPMYFFCVCHFIIPEPVFVHVLEDQESIPRNRFRRAGNRFLDFLKGLQTRGLIKPSLLTSWWAGSVYVDMFL
jgi:hypothetical protein